MAKPKKKPTTPSAGPTPPESTPDAGSPVLTERQFKGLAALIASPSTTKAAAHCGIPLRTLEGWLAEPAFRKAYHDACKQAVTDATRRLQADSLEAAVTLRRCLRDMRGSVRIAAAKMILDHAIRTVLIDDLFARLAELEAKSKALTTGGQAG